MPPREQAAMLVSPRVVLVADLRPCENHITILPGGYVLLDATPEELLIISLYTRELDHIKPPLTAECQSIAELSEPPTKKL